MLILTDDKEIDLQEIVAVPTSATSTVGKETGFRIFGLDPTNTQDWITVVLTGIIVYETFDLVVFWFQKLTGFQGFQSS